MDKKKIKNWVLLIVSLTIVVVSVKANSNSERTVIVNTVKNSDMSTTSTTYATYNTSDVKQVVKDLTKEEIQKEVIVDFILDSNPKLTKVVANSYAVRIVNNSEKDGYSPYIQAALIDTESNYVANPKHLLACDKGMTGTNINVWANDLKAAGIIKNISDLSNPIVSIDASSFIIKHYMLHYDGKTYDAISGYKGYCKVGKQNARKVIELAVAIKKKEVLYS
jgi:hypothetical protein